MHTQICTVGTKWQGRVEKASKGPISPVERGFFVLSREKSDHGKFYANLPPPQEKPQKQQHISPDNKRISVSLFSSSTSLSRKEERGKEDAKNFSPFPL